MHNSVTIQGNLTTDVVVKNFDGGRKVANFGVACTRNFKNSDGNRDSDFFYVNAWNANADRCSQLLKKGSQIIINGRLRSNIYTADDGTKRSTVDIELSDFNFCGGRNENENAGEQTRSATPVKNIKPVAASTSDDLPF